MWLALAAPASFLAVESASHCFLASVSHFFMWLVSAAPASFLSAESLLQVANALVATSESAAARMTVFMEFLLNGDNCTASGISPVHIVPRPMAEKRQTR